MSIGVHQLTKRYAGCEVVNDVSFRVDDGELVALLGPSGSGKSTIVRIVAGLTSAELGRVSVDGLDVTALPPQSRDLGFVFQNHALFEPSRWRTTWSSHCGCARSGAAGVQKKLPPLAGELMFQESIG